MSGIDVVGDMVASGAHSFYRRTGSLGIALALEQPQAAADHGEKVVDVVDDELSHVGYRPHPLPPARGDRATRVGPRVSVATNPRYLAVGPDERDLRAPGRNDAATAIADAPHPCA